MLWRYLQSDTIIKTDCSSEKVLKIHSQSSHRLKKQVNISLRYCVDNVQKEHITHQLIKKVDKLIQDKPALCETVVILLDV